MLTSWKLKDRPRTYLFSLLFSRPRQPTKSNKEKGEKGKVGIVKMREMVHHGTKTKFKRGIFWMHRKNNLLTMYIY